MYKILDSINSPQDLKNLSKDELLRYSIEIRDFLIDNVSKTGGHLASNLGVIELTIALHYVFDSPKDKLIWDVGHQGYVHKIITGRKELFNTLRKKNGLSGFLKRSESEHDIFDAGHSSTSISAALGVAISNEYFNKSINKAIAIIGDGALTSGMALEAINHAGHLQKNILVVLNDNEMSISQNVGAISKQLMKVRSTKAYLNFKKDVVKDLNKFNSGSNILRFMDKMRMTIKQLVLPVMFFEELGFKYFGPVDGHDIDVLIEILEKIKNIDGPVLLHVMTKKGKGYLKAEQSPDEYHGVSSFNIDDGIVSSSDSFSHVFGNKLLEMAKEKDNIVAITAAMPSGTGLGEFMKVLPDRFIDVGIAEQHATTLSASLSLNGIKPYFAVYSTFLQRAVDQVLHDIAMQNCDVVLCIDRAGIVGQDGETHQGLYDISFLSMIPNMTIITPKDSYELERCLEFSYSYKKPLAIRYPREKSYVINNDQSDILHPEILIEGDGLCVVSFGRLLKDLSELIIDIPNVSLINGRINKPLNTDFYFDLLNKHNRVLFFEETTRIGSTAQFVISELTGKNCDLNKIRIFTIPDEYILQGTIPEILDKYGLSKEKMRKTILENLND
jgi:1-deoxy-D-xylulose-5-phosphate synthase